MVVLIKLFITQQHRWFLGVFHYPWRDFTKYYFFSPLSQNRFWHFLNISLFCVSIFERRVWEMGLGRSICRFPIFIANLHPFLDQRPRPKHVKLFFPAFSWHRMSSAKLRNNLNASTWEFFTQSAASVKGVSPLMSRVIVLALAFRSSWTTSGLI